MIIYLDPNGYLSAEASSDKASNISWWSHYLKGVYFPVYLIAS